MKKTILFILLGFSLVFLYGCAQQTPTESQNMEENSKEAEVETGQENELTKAYLISTNWGSWKFYEDNTFEIPSAPEGDAGVEGTYELANNQVTLHFKTSLGKPISPRKEVWTYGISKDSLLHTRYIQHLYGHRLSAIESLVPEGEIRNYKLGPYRVKLIVERRKLNIKDSSVLRELPLENAGRYIFYTYEDVKLDELTNRPDCEDGGGIIYCSQQMFGLKSIARTQEMEIVNSKKDYWYLAKPSGTQYMWSYLALQNPLIKTSKTNIIYYGYDSKHINIYEDIWIHGSDLE